MALDAKNLKIIDAEDVPERGRRRTKWDDIFDAIDKGKALVVDESDAHHSTIRQALRKRQEKGLYKDYYVTTRGSKGSRKTYVVHEKLE